MFLVRRTYHDRRIASRVYDGFVLWLSDNQGMGDRLRETFSVSFQELARPHLLLPDLHWHLAMCGYKEEKWWVSFHTYYDPSSKDDCYGVTACVEDEIVGVQMVLSL